MLVLYTASLWFPGGAPAANHAVTVHHRASNRVALLFTDSTGSTRASNPVTTDDFGQAVFWAAPGHYVTDLAGTLFDYLVDPSTTDPVWPDLWTHTQSTPATAWEIAHHFGVHPQAEILVGSEVTQAAVSHPDNEHITITFGEPTAGIAHLRR